MQNLHCKISLDDQFRRFLFKYSPLPSSFGEENPFKQLQNQVRTLYGIDGDFALKYKDDEGDLIILESDAELNCAVAHSAGLLRLFVEFKEPMTDDATKITTTTTSTVTTTTPTTTTTPLSPSENTYSYHPGRYGHPGRGRYGRGGCRGGNHEHGGQGHHHHGKHNRSGGQFKVGKLTAKREMIVAALNDPQVNADESKKLKLQRKLECIERRLAIFNSIEPAQTLPSEGNQVSESSSSASSSREEKWRKKKCDKYNQYHEKSGKRERKIRRNLSDDEKSMLLALKTQIWEMKPAFVTVKIQLREKKAMKADAKKKGDKQRVEELKKEIQQLKELKKDHKKAIAPLKSQIYALKFEKEKEQV